MVCVLLAAAWMRKINRPASLEFSFQVAHKHSAAEITILPPPLLSFLQAADAGGGGVLAAVLSGIQVIERGKCAYECCWHAGQPAGRGFWLLQLSVNQKSHAEMQLST
jgi:hypothetical protein